MALYARVSTDGQTCENQLAELRRVAEASGSVVVGEYVDAGISGGKGRDQRPQFDAMLKDAVRRRFTMVMAWSVDRLGRSMQDLGGFLGEMHATGTDLYLHQQGIDTTTPAGKALFGMFSLFAEFERAMIQERVKAGLARARAQGKRLGQKPVSAEVEDAIRAHRAQGMGKKKIAREVGCGVGTVMRVVREDEAATGQTA